MKTKKNFVIDVKDKDNDVTSFFISANGNVVIEQEWREAHGLTFNSVEELETIFKNAIEKIKKETGIEI